MGPIIWSYESKLSIPTFLVHWNKLPHTRVGVISIKVIFLERNLFVEFIYKPSVHETNKHDFTSSYKFMSFYLRIKIGRHHVKVTVLQATPIFPKILHFGQIWTFSSYGYWTLVGESSNFKGQKALWVFSLGKLQEKLKAYFATKKILANDMRLLEKDTAFNVEWFEH